MLRASCLCLELVADPIVRACALWRGWKGRRKTVVIHSEIRGPCDLTEAGDRYDFMWFCVVLCSCVSHHDHDRDRWRGLKG